MKLLRLLQDMKFSLVSNMLVLTLQIKSLINKHNHQFKRNYSAPVKTNQKNIQCHRCKKMGHISKNCRVQLDKGKEQFNSKNRQAFKFRTKTIAMCRSNIDSILSLKAFINKEPVKLSLDSGAVESIMSRKTVERFGLSMADSAVKIKTATNEVRQVLGETEEVTVDIQGHTCRMPFLVLDMEDHEVLLGLNWFEQTGAGIFPSEKILRFPGHTVHLLKDESSYESFDDPFEVYVSEIIDEPDIEDDSEWDTVEGPTFEPAVPLLKDQLKELKAVIKKIRICLH